MLQSITECLSPGPQRLTLNLHKPRRYPIIPAVAEKKRPQVSGEQVEWNHCITALTLLTEQVLMVESKHEGHDLKNYVTKCLFYSSAHPKTIILGRIPSFDWLVPYGNRVTGRQRTHTLVHGCSDSHQRAEMLRCSQSFSSHLLCKDLLKRHEPINHPLNQESVCVFFLTGFLDR